MTPQAIKLLVLAAELILKKLSHPCGLMTIVSGRINNPRYITYCDIKGKYKKCANCIYNGGTSFPPKIKIEVDE